MKKLIKLFSIILIASLLLSCEEEIGTPDTSNDGLITLAQLDGQWYFDYYEYDGIQWNWNNLSEDYENIEQTFNHWGFDTKRMTAYRGVKDQLDLCAYLKFSKSADKIKIYKNFSFTVVSYEENLLKLKLDELWSTECTGGILVLIK